MTDVRYPVGKFERVDSLSSAEREGLIAEIAEAPARMRAAIHGLGDRQLDTPYREGGWTVRQVVHHVPDSHVNAYCRFKLALTEDHPTIRPYDEARWAELRDSRDTPVATSVALLESLHDRWTRLLRSMTDADFRRTLLHPDSGAMSMDNLLALYGWHGRHHVAHITTLRGRMGW